MSERALQPEAIPATNEPLRVAVRRLRWFKQAFQRHAEAYGRDLGCTFEVDEAKLASAFVRWLEAIERQKPSDKTERRAFFEFAAALMLRELVAGMPVRAVAAPTRAAADSAAAFWPEGYCCTCFCLSIHAAAMEQEFHAGTEVAAEIDDLRQWWSFRENAVRDASFSAGFLQMMLGQQPNWVLPDVFRARVAQEIETVPADRDV
jgi:hypothetical protein